MYTSDCALIQARPILVPPLLVARVAHPRGGDQVIQRHIQFGFRIDDALLLASVPLRALHVPCCVAARLLRALCLRAPWPSSAPGSSFEPIEDAGRPLRSLRTPGPHCCCTSLRTALARLEAATVAEEVARAGEALAFQELLDSLLLLHYVLLLGPGLPRLAPGGPTDVGAACLLKGGQTNHAGALGRRCRPIGGLCAATVCGGGRCLAPARLLEDPAALVLQRHNRHRFGARGRPADNRCRDAGALTLRALRGPTLHDVRVPCEPATAPRSCERLCARCSPLAERHSSRTGAGTASAGRGRATGGP
eukprot:scaffold1202_cov384-Prasinococcus_capsulatus_cf.AAC.6